MLFGTQTKPVLFRRSMDLILTSLSLQSALEKLDESLLFFKTLGYHTNYAVQVLHLPVKTGGDIKP